MAESLPRWVILDRDGVINADPPVSGPARAGVLSVAQWQPLPGALEALARLTRAGVGLAVATNQSAVGRGWLSAAELARIHLRMLAAVEAAGGRLAAIAVCPHAPDQGCDCRKPAPGLLWRLAECLRFVPGEAALVGDQARDIQAAHAAGMRACAVGAAARAAWGVPCFADLAALTAHWLGAAR